MSQEDHGKPIKDQPDEAVDRWSREVFDACRDWPLARAGRWFQADEGYLRLRIEEVDGEALEPLSVIELETSEGRLLVDFGKWATPLSGYGKAAGWGAEDAVAEARALVEGWLRDDVRLAVYSDAGGWRGSKIIEGGSLPDAVEPVPVALGDGAQVVVRTFRRSDWRCWARTPEGGWAEREVGPG